MEQKTLIKLVVGSEAIFFLALLMAFVYFTYVPVLNPRVASSLDLNRTSLFTVMLLSSSVTFWRAEVSFRRGRTKQLRLWLLCTVVLGVVFLVGQGSEYSSLLSRQLTVSKGTFTTSFFTLTGFHGLHVLIGIVVLSIVLYLTFLGDLDDPDSALLPSVGIYWHFVDVVWAVVFVIVYVLPHFLTGHTP